MADFQMKIAGHTGAVRSIFESTRDYCRSYLTDEEPEFFAATTREDLAFEQAMLDVEAREEGLKPRRFTEPFLERASIQRKFAEFLLDHDTLLFHGSAVALEGQGYLFTAPCGTGKSTHTRLWREVFGEKAVMINDDKPFLRLTEDGVLVCGAPWSGKHGLDTNISVPLKGICILERGTGNRIRQIGAEEALPMLLHQSCPPLESGRLAHFTALVEALAAKTPLWHMECTKEPQAAMVSRQAMGGVREQ